MSNDEAARHALRSSLEGALGDDAAATLMEHLPPMRWDQLATKDDIGRLDRRFDEVLAHMDERFAASDRRMDERFAATDRRMDERFADTDRRMAEQFADTDRRIDERFADTDRRIDERFAATDRRIDERYAAADRRMTEQYADTDRRKAEDFAATMLAIRTTGEAVEQRMQDGFARAHAETKALVATDVGLAMAQQTRGLVLAQMATLVALVTIVLAVTRL